MNFLTTVALIALTSAPAFADDLWATKNGKNANLTVEMGCVTGQFKTDDLGKNLLTDDEFKKSFKKLKTDQEKAANLQAAISPSLTLTINGVAQAPGTLTSVSATAGEKNKLNLKACVTVNEALKAALSHKEQYAIGGNVVSITLNRNGRADRVTYLPGEIGGDDFLTLLGAPRPFTVNFLFPAAFANASYASRGASGKPGIGAQVISENLGIMAFGGYEDTFTNLNDKAETLVGIWGVNPDKDFIYIIDVRGLGKVTVLVLAKESSEEAAKIAVAAKEKYPNDHFLVYTYAQLAEQNKLTPNPKIDVWTALSSK